jgi:hypothetical protein
MAKRCLLVGLPSLSAAACLLLAAAAAYGKPPAGGPPGHPSAVAHSPVATSSSKPRGDHDGPGGGTKPTGSPSGTPQGSALAGPHHAPPEPSGRHPAAETDGGLPPPRHRGSEAAHHQPPSPDEPSANAEKRRTRRTQRTQELTARFGHELVARPNVRAELARHAWRIARLNKMAELAQTAKNDKFVTRVERLRQAENTRHESRLEKLKQNPSEATGGAPSALSATPSANPASSPSGDTRGREHRASEGAKP